MTEHDLGDGLVMRWARPEDLERQVTLTAEVFLQYPGGPPSVEVEPWSRELGSGTHPQSGIDRLAIVEDVRRGIMVSCTWLISMSVAYGDIVIPVGRPEHVATHPDYRRRGLVGKLFEMIHQRSEADGDLVQMITGIPYFYRQFGYEYALELGGGSIVERAAVHRLRDDTGFRVRVAHPDELTATHDLFMASQEHCLVRNDFSDTYWRWLHDGINPATGFGWQSLVVLDRDDRLAGAVLMLTRRWGRLVDVLGIAAGTGRSLHEILPPALRAIDEVAANLLPMPVESMPEYDALRFQVGSGHSVHQLLAHECGGRFQPGYAWLVRTSNLPRLLQTIAPVLESRLAASPLRGYTGRLALDFYRSGLTIAFERGTITGFEEGRVEPAPRAAAGMPPGVFLQLVFGRRTLEELKHILPDTWATPEAELLIDSVFPAVPSNVLPVN
jgi:hypothetical protein